MAEKNLLSTFGDILVELGRGVSNTTEGLVDAHIAPVAWVGGLFDKGFKEKAKNTIAYDWTSDHFNQWGFDNVKDKSFISDFKYSTTVRDIVEGVGAMLPSLALSTIPYAGPALSMATMSMGAGGKNMEAAINEGAEFDNAFLYGIASGSLEAGIEKLGGFVMGGGSSVIGKRLAGTSIGKFTSKGVGKALEVGVSEAGEEVLTSYIDPFVKAGTGVDSDLGGNLQEAFENTGNTALTGAAVGSILHGGQVIDSNIKNTASHRGGAKATRADSQYASFVELNENYGADEKLNTKTVKAQGDFLRSMSQEIQGMDKASRKKYLESSPIKQAFNDDGTLKVDLVRADTNVDAVSGSIRTYSGTFKHAPITSEEVIGEGARATKSYIEQILGSKAKVIITSELGADINASYSSEEGVFYINNSANENAAVHEIYHYTEGTKEFLKLNVELYRIAIDKNAPDYVKRRIGNKSARIEDTLRRYGADMENLTEKQAQYLFDTEFNADLTGDLLTDEYFITQLAQRNENVFKKLYNLVKSLNKKSIGVDGESKRYLKDLLKKFEKAIDNAHGGVSLKSIGSADEEKDDKTSDVESETAETGIRFSKKREDYPYSMQTVIQEYMESVDEDLFNVATEHRNNKNTPFVRQKICEVDADFVSEIQAIFDMDITGFTVNINTSAFNHIEKRHGLNGEADKSMANLKDLARIGYVIENKDSVEPILKNGEQVYSKEFRKKDGEPAPLILLKKKINGTYYCAIAVTDGKYKKVWVQSAFINKRDGLTQILHDEISSLSYTSETVAASHPSTDIIPESGEIVNSDERKSKKRSYTPGEDVNGKKITLGMSDAERTEILKNKKIHQIAEAQHFSQDVVEKIPEIHTWEDIDKYFGKQKRNLIQKIADEFKVFKQYENSDVSLSFEFTNNNFRESYGKQKNKFVSFAKMFSVFDTVIENAVGIEVHKRTDYKPDPTLKNVYVLMSVFVDGDYFIPVKLEIKEFNDKQNKLYVAIALDGIKKTEVSKQGTTEIGVAQSSRSVNISILDLMKKINPSNTNFTKYFPKSILTQSQKELLDSDIHMDERKSKKRSYTPAEDVDADDDGNVWTEAEDGGVKILFSVPDFSNPTYEKKNAPGYRLSDTYDGESPEQYVIVGKHNILTEYSKLNKFVADNIKLKKYSRKDAKATFEEILTERDYFTGLDVKFKGKSRAEIERMLWNALNSKASGQRGAAALEIADAIIMNMLVTEQYEMAPELELAYQVVSYLKTHLHNVNLDHIKGDIKVKYDKDTSPYALWARKEGARGVTADQIKEEIEVEIPGIRISATNEADIFLEIDELYRSAREIIKDSTPEKTTLMGVMDSKDIKSLRQSIARDIMDAYEKRGAETRFSKLEKKYLDRISKLSQGLYDAKRMNNMENKVLKQVKKIADNRDGVYKNATQAQTGALENIKSLLARINSREQINRSSTRDIMQAFAEWYKEDNPVLEGFYLKEMAEIVSYFSESKGKAKLTYFELDIIHTVLRHMNFVFENYGKVYRLGKYVDAKEEATKHLQIMKDAQSNQSTVEKLMLKNKAIRFFMDPIAVSAQYDGHDENGFFTTTLKEFQEGLVMQRYYEMKALEEFKEFTEKKHKKYFKELLKGKRTISVGVEYDLRETSAEQIKVPVYYAMELYMASKTGDAMKTLEETGWMLKLDDAKEQKKMSSLSKEQLEGIYNQFTAEDKELIEIMERAYNGTCKDLKYDTDMKRLGFSNIIEGYYHPMYRFTATDFDSNDFFVEMERVSKVGFNNNRVKGAKQALIIGNAFTTFIRHVNAVSRYSALSIPISNMKMVYNMDVGDNPNMPSSIKMQALTDKVWDGAEEYFQKLADDVQQIGIKPDEGSKMFAYLRGAYAKSALGANPKVWFSQLSSYLASFGELRFSSLAKAVTIKGFVKDSDVDNYCKLAAVRHYERGATKAMTVTDKIGTVGQVLTAPIEMVDRQVIKMLFAACQAEAKSRYRLEIGTEENKIKAGEILTDVILKSQQNQLVTEQSAAMRSTSEFTKSFTMFNADSMKLLSRFIEYVGKTATLKKKMKSAQASGNTELYEQISKQHKSAVKHLCKYSAAIVSIAVYMALVAKLFKWLYNKDDEEESTWSGLGKDIAGNLVGMVPIVRDIYSYFDEGYDVENYAYSMLGDLLKAVDNTKNAFVNLASGKEVSSERWSSSLRSLTYAISQFMGIPTRNIYNFTTGIIRRVDEGTGLKIDSVFYAPSSTALKEKYLEGKEKGNKSLVSASLELMYKNRDIEISDTVLKREMDRLIDKNLTKGKDDKANYSPLSVKTPDTVTFEGDEIELTSKQKNAFKTAYKTAEVYSAKAVKTAMYKGLDDESKAYALRKVYEYYHRSALEDVTGERARLVYFGSFIGIDKLALIIAYAKEAESDAKGSRREKIEAFIKKFGLTKSQASLALRYLGYSDKEMDSQVQSLIKARSGLTREQREEFLGMI